MSELSSSPLSRRGARKAAARLSRLFTGNGSSTIKPISSSDTLCQAVAAPAAQEASLQDSSSSVVTSTPVTIVLARRVGFGDRIAVVGDTQALGCWSVLDGVPLQWQEGDVWRGEVSLQPGMHEFKCVTLKADGGQEWELGSNRVVQVPAGSDALLASCEPC
ncbi:hypothetical protein OEZ85_005234 [Tetradesmus obliquus]|uniref:CBM20 domain-containing protein n=1 Tax=Tetradesmus obliquus TaxID=3088 RepID=A0ABY8UJP0_TETOB|nr:hypothetical protein OEZ85_005234 [Tetradesmus obliquus]